MAPRSIWNGTIAFGLVNVPVKVYSATESKTVHFHQVHLADGARIEHRRVCPKEDKAVPHDEIRPTKDIDGAGGRTKKREVEQAVALIEALSCAWDPERYGDGYRKRLQAIVKRKQNGGKVTAPKPDTKAAAPVPDLMAALEESMARLKDGGDLRDLSREELAEALRG